MQFFSDFEKVRYKFGNEETTNIFQNITTYSALFDDVKDDISFYNTMTIPQGWRPDQLSISLYDTPLYYWTFYLFNDEIRSRGWPLDYSALDHYIKERYPYVYIITRTDITNKFKVGRTITGSTSGATGKIIHRDKQHNLMVVQTNDKFTAGESASSEYVAPGGSVIETLVVASSAEYYNAPHHYYTSEQNKYEWVDYDPLIGPGAQLVEMTNYDQAYNKNEDLRTIRVVRPDLIAGLVSSYKKSVRG